MIRVMLGVLFVICAVFLEITAVIVWRQGDRLLGGVWIALGVVLICAGVVMGKIGYDDFMNEGR